MSTRVAADLTYDVHASFQITTNTHADDRQSRSTATYLAHVSHDTSSLSGPSASVQMTTYPIVCLIRPPPPLCPYEVRRLCLEGRAMASAGRGWAARTERDEAERRMRRARNRSRTCTKASHDKGKPRYHTVSDTRCIWHERALQRKAAFKASVHLLTPPETRSDTATAIYSRFRNEREGV
eukprot:603188-Pyramimonas_sp.AAC.1